MLDGSPEPDCALTGPTSSQLLKQTLKAIAVILIGIDPPFGEIEK
jgi:hypothetical protein